MNVLVKFNWNTYFHTELRRTLVDNGKRTGCQIPCKFQSVDKDCSYTVSFLKTKTYNVNKITHDDRGEKAKLYNNMQFYLNLLPAFSSYYMKVKLHIVVDVLALRETWKEWEKNGEKQQQIDEIGDY